jgi:hypothetical protein
MYTLRCTQKLLRRIVGALPDSTAAPTTRLGDWYANLLFSKPQHLVLCVSERTLLPIVIPAKEIQLLPLRLADGVRDVLVALGIDPSLAEQEWEKMQSCQFGKTASEVDPKNWTGE